MPEVRTVSASGGAKGQKPCQLSSIPPYAMEKLGEVFGMGAEKYGAHNYRKGYEASKSIDALFRHVLRYLDGEDSPTHDDEAKRLWTVGKEL